LKNGNLSEEEKDSLQTQRQELDDEIEALSQEQKRLKADAFGKHKTFLESSKALKEEQAKKQNLTGPPPQQWRIFCRTTKSLLQGIMVVS
jgi:hypothetical protein